jgi:hypothetical protein
MGFLSIYCFSYLKVQKSRRDYFFAALLASDVIFFGADLRFRIWGHPFLFTPILFSVTPL